MGGLKSGSGDDLWGDDEEERDESGTEEERTDSNESGAPEEATEREPGVNSSDRAKMSGGLGGESGGSTQHSYIVRRAVQDKSVQFERDERLTFFVHDDVAEGERELLSDAETALGRSVPKFDLREAVYRAALRNKKDVLAELVKMGYSLDDD
jgi:hypothetical protein